MEHGVWTSRCSGACLAPFAPTERTAVDLLLISRVKVDLLVSEAGNMLETENKYGLSISTLR